MKFFTVVLLGFLVVGCITLTEEEKLACAGSEEGAAICEASLIERKKEDRKYAIEERDAEFRDEFIQFYAACQAAGGVIWVRRTGAGPICHKQPCMPRWQDSYGCQRK